MTPKVAIIYLCWADEPKKYLSDALDAVAKQNYPRENLSLVIVYNGPRAGEESQIDFIRDRVKKREQDLPETNILEPGSNIGFSAGNNFGARFAVEHGADYVLLHNADGYLGETAISELVKIMEGDKAIGECQPVIYLHHEHDLINSAGNDYHYLGIGYCSRYREAAREFPDFSEVGYASGAAAFMRADLIKRFGYWRDEFYLYHEDTEYSLRLKTLGYKVGLVGRAKFFHKYEFSNKPNKFFWIERNRHALKLIFYKWPTLILLLPLEILYNLGLVFLSISKGWFGELMKVYKYWLTPKNWVPWIAQRKAIQAERKITDREFMAQMKMTINPVALGIAAPLMFIVNIVFTFYYFLIKLLVWW